MPQDTPFFINVRFAGEAHCSTDSESELGRRCKKDEELQAHLEYCRDLANEGRVERALDVIDRALGGAKNMTKSELTAAIFTLKCKGGWNEKQEITGRDGGPLAMIVAPVRNISAEDWKRENLGK